MHHEMRASRPAFDNKLPAREEFVNDQANGELSMMAFS